MAYKIAGKAANREFSLMGLDDSGETTVLVRKATGNDQLRLEEIVATEAVTYKVDGIMYTRQPSTPKYLSMAAKTWLVMVKCNIIDANDKPLFNEDMKWGEFMAAYDQLPAEARKEIYDAIVEENPHWGDPIGGVFA